MPVTRHGFNKDTHHLSDGLLPGDSFRLKVHGDGYFGTPIIRLTVDGYFGTPIIRLTVSH